VKMEAIAGVWFRRSKSGPFGDFGLRRARHGSTRSGIGSSCRAKWKT